ncbi:MAG TPA: hypothetical protein VH417_04395 [Vicinamibacterales bacterium]
MATLALAALLAPARMVRADEIIERVLAVAGGDLIMMSDVRAARELGLIDPGRAADPDREVLTRLIDRALVLAEVDRYQPPEPSTEAVDQQLAAIRARFASPDALNAALTRLGLDQDRLREQVREDLRIRAYLDQRFAAENVEQRDRAVTDWIAGLRRRADVVDSYSRP